MIGFLKQMLEQLIKGKNVIKNYLLTVGTLAAIVTAPVVIAAEQMSAAQQQQIEKVVHDYLIAHPEVLIEASQVLQQKQQENAQLQAKEAIASNAGQLFKQNMAVVGNTKGNVTLVEFFDYQCSHCKNMAPVVNNLLQQDKSLRVVYKEFPIFGKTSEMASQAALAAAMQGKYQQMNEALLKLNVRLDEDVIMKTAKSLNLDMKKLQADMKSKTVQDMLASNRELAEKMHLMGTPAFIIAATPNGQFDSSREPSFIPGAASEASLQDLIKKSS